jgi:protein-S-isoprenylcysteine O-methyltransferase Ste14
MTISVYSRSQRVVAALYGLACHTAFAAGVSAMVVGIYSGMRLGHGGVRGSPASLVDVGLLAQFAIVHSVLLSERGRTLLSRLAPLGLGAALRTTTFALVSSLQLALTFVAWAPLGEVWWEPHGPLRVAFTSAYAVSWLLLLKTMADAGLGVQTGHLGWTAVVRGEAPRYGDFPARGTFRHVRQPIYVAFALILWTGPVWTPDHLLVAVGWTAYCLLGPLFKERRYLGFYGVRFERYRRLVPYWCPRLRPVDVSGLRADEPGTQTRSD